MSTQKTEPYDEFLNRVQQAVIDHCRQNDSIYVKSKWINDRLGETKRYTGRALAELESEWDALEHYTGGCNAKTWIVDQSQISIDD